MPNYEQNEACMSAQAASVLVSAADYLHDYVLRLTFNEIGFAPESLYERGVRYPNNTSLNPKSVIRVYARLVFVSSRLATSLAKS